MQAKAGSTSTSTARVLVIEDDRTLAATLRYNLRKHGYEVSVTGDGLEGVKLARSTLPDLVVLDLMLPGMDGREVCRYLRSWTDAPILMLTALDSEENVVEGFELGADDYVSKPFHMRELLARVEALVRRARRHSSESNRLQAGDLVVLIDEHRAFYGDRELRLAPKEFALLIALMRRAGKVSTRAELMKEAWGEDVIVDPRNIDVHVRLIRAQLEGEPDGTWLIQTVHGIGYRLNAESG